MNDLGIKTNTDRGDQLDQRGRRALRPAMVASGVFAGVIDQANRLWVADI